MDWDRCCVPLTRGLRILWGVLCGPLRVLGKTLLAERFYIVDFVDEFPFIEPSLYPWDDAYLIMMDDCFDAFLDLVCKNFV